jgi:hypothetical protein
VDDSPHLVEKVHFGIHQTLQDLDYRRFTWRWSPAGLCCIHLFEHAPQVGRHGGQCF